MRAEKDKSSESHVDVRFNKFFGIVIILLSHAPLVYATQQIISLKREFFQGTNFVLPAIAVVAGLLIIAAGMSQSKRWHLRLDGGNQILMVSYGISSLSKKHSFDSLYFAGEKIYIEKSGVKKKIGFLKVACNRKDLKSLILALKETA